MHFTKNSSTNNSCFSTKHQSTITTPTSSFHDSNFSLSVLKEKLRIKTKQSLIVYPKNKSTRKQKSQFNESGLINRNNVNWIVYNILVGIYQNWLRLSPYLLHLLDNNKFSMQNIRLLTQKIKKDKQEIQKWTLSQKDKKNIQSDLKPNTLNCTDKMLEEIQQACNSIKYTTQLINGFALINVRQVKTQKQNKLANQLIQKLNEKYIIDKSILVDDQVEKVAQSIVQRIQAFKYLKQNKMKITPRIMSPLRRIFNDSKEIDKQKQFTAQQIIQKIKETVSKPKKEEHNEQMKKYVIENDQHKQTQQNSKNNIKQQTDKQNNHNKCIISEKNFDLGYQISQKRIRNNHGNGLFIQQDSDSQGSHKILKPAINFHSTRKFVLNKQGKRTMKVLIQQNNNVQIIHETHRKSGQILLSKHSEKKISQKQINKGKDTSKSKNKKKTYANKENEKSKQLQDKQKGGKFASIGTFARLRTKRIIEQKDQDIFSIDSNKSIDDDIIPKNKYRKLALKQGRLHKKRQTRRSNADNYLSSTSDNRQRKQNQQYFYKKNKIFGSKTSNFQNKQQDQQEYKKNKQSKKVILTTEKQMTQKKIKKNRRHCLSQDTLLISASGLHLQQKQKKNDKWFETVEKPFEFLTQFNKQATKNWIYKTYRPKEPDYLVSKKDKCQGIDCDLQMPTIKKQQQNKQKQNFVKETNSLDFSLSFIKSYFYNTLRQKPINIEKQIQV